MRRRIALPLVATVLVLAGCQGSGDGPGTGSASSSRTPTQGADDAPTSADKPYDTTYDRVKPQVSREAVARFGAAQAKTGTEQVVALAEDVGFDQALITAERPEGKQRLLAYTSQMTPVARRDWVRVVNYNMTHWYPLGTHNSLVALALYTPYEESDKFNGEHIAIATEGPAAVNQKIRSVKTSLSGERLSVEVKASADLRVTIGEEPFVLRLDRRTAYYLVTSSDGWKIDGWYGDVLPHPPRVEQ